MLLLRLALDIEKYFGVPAILPTCDRYNRKQTMRSQVSISVLRRGFIKVPLVVASNFEQQQMFF